MIIFHNRHDYFTDYLVSSPVTPRWSVDLHLQWIAWASLDNMFTEVVGNTHRFFPPSFRSF